MELFRTPLLISCNGPASQQLICGAIVIGHMHSPACVDDGFDVRRTAYRSLVHLPMRGEGDHRQYSCRADRYDLGRPHDSVFSPARQRQVAESLIQAGVELGPNLVFLAAGYMAVAVFFFLFHLGSLSFRLLMIKIVLPPPASVGVALRVLDGHVGAIQTPWEITPSRRFGSRTVRVVS